MIMQYTKDLVFFDKNGNGYSFDYDQANDLWTGAIYIEPVSKGLFETEKICIAQKYCTVEESENSSMTNPTKAYEYAFPCTVSSDIGSYYRFEWDSEVHEVDEISMFSFNVSYCQPEDTSALTYNEYDCPSLIINEYVDTDALGNYPLSAGGGMPIPANDPVFYRATHTKTVDWRQEYAEVNLCFCNKDDEYETFRRDLHLYYCDANQGKFLVGVFSVYAKSVEEDERLSIMCHNLGYDISNVDFSIFQDSDIKEQLVDYDLMNIKRKEMLLEGHNIYSYIGSYKSLINAIRFFGYDNVTIKEWWKNIDMTSEDYGKHFTASSYSLEDHEVIRSNETITLPSRKFRKTGKLTLTYGINKCVDNAAISSYYGHAYPETEEHFTYTIEEALIKLYGLKRKLEKEFLPLTTKIIDIVGETSSFNVSTLRDTPSSSHSFSVNASVRAGFSILGSEDGMYYIEDLRPFGIHSSHELPHGNGMVGDARTGNADYLGSYQSAIDAITDTTGSDFQQFGTNNIGDYNTNWNDNGSMTGSDNIEGYAQNWDVDEIQNFRMTGSLSDIEEIAGTGSCYTGTDYVGPTGVIPPYEMQGNSLFGVTGPTVNNCKPWIYYIQDNEDNYGNYYLAEFSNYYPNLNETYKKANDFDSDENTHLPDNENIPIGALIELKIDEIPIPWDDVVFTWDYADCITWDCFNLFANNISRVEWHVHKEEDANPGFDTKICGTIMHGYSDIGIVLPYVGKYDVKMVIYDWNNNMSIVSKPGSIEVMPREVEFTGWCKMKTNLLTWMSDRIWDSLSTEWNFPYVNDITWNDVKSASFNGLDRGFFAGQYADTDETDERMMIYNFDDTVAQNVFGLVEDNRGSYFWDNLDTDWDSMSHLWWDAMNIGGDIPCYFVFGCFDNTGNPIDSTAGTNDSLPGKWLEIVDEDNNYGSFRFPNTTSSVLNYIADVTRQLNESTDPVISKFYYSYIWDVHNNMHPNLDVPDGFHIVAVAKNHGKNGDVKHVGIVSTMYHAYVDPNNNVLHVRIDPDNKQLFLFTDTKEYNPNWNDLVCINNVTRIPAYTDVNFNYTNCRILGKKNPVWKFTNLNTGTIFVSKNKNYHRMFKEKGCWEVSLTLNDTNNNVYNAKRNVLIIC